MMIEYYHASEYGNGARVAEEFKRLMNERGVKVEIHHVQEARPKELSPADLYVFSSPGRLGKPIRGMRSFLKKVKLAPGTKYAILTTEMAPQPDKKTGRIPTEEEIARWRRMVPIMDELLQAKGLKKVHDGRVLVMNIEGPLEEGWQKKVETFVTEILELA